MVLLAIFYINIVQVVTANAGSRKFKLEGAIFELFSGSEVIEYQNINQICWKILQQQMILLLQ